MPRPAPPGDRQARPCRSPAEARSPRCRRRGTGAWPPAWSRRTAPPNRGRRRPSRGAPAPASPEPGPDAGSCARSHARPHDKGGAAGTCGDGDPLQREHALAQHRPATHRREEYGGETEGGGLGESRLRKARYRTRIAPPFRMERRACSGNLRRCDARAAGDHPERQQQQDAEELAPEHEHEGCRVWLTPRTAASMKATTRPEASIAERGASKRCCARRCCATTVELALR